MKIEYVDHKNFPGILNEIEYLTESLECCDNTILAYGSSFRHSCLIMDNSDNSHYYSIYDMEVIKDKYLYAIRIDVYDDDECYIYSYSCSNDLTNIFIANKCLKTILNQKQDKIKYAKKKIRKRLRPIEFKRDVDFLEAMMLPVAAILGLLFMILYKSYY